MIRLGIRFALHGGRFSLASATVTAVAVSFGTAVLLFALTLQPALEARYARAAWRDTPGAADIASVTGGLLMAVTEDRVAGEPLIRVDVAALSDDAPLPPGLSRLPGRGESLVSPALMARLAITPADQLGERFGNVVGTLGEAGLKAPDELAVVVGESVDSLRTRANSVVVTELATEAKMPELPLFAVIIVLIAVVGALVPVVVFVATATRLSAARREQRLALLRLVGATPRQVHLMAAGEALAATIPGTLLGVAVFVLTRPLIARIPVDQAGWFVDAMVPPMPQAIALLVAIPLLGVVTSIVALRRVALSPLGVTRRQTGRPLSRLRLVPLAVSLVLFGVGVVGAAQSRGAMDPAVLLLLGSYFGIVIGIAVAGPWLTALAGRALVRLSRGPSLLLAARRLIDEPRAAFGAISGVVMAVFIASACFTFLGFVNDTADRAVGYPLRDGAIQAQAQPGSDLGPAVVGLVALPGVTGVTAIRSGSFVDKDGSVINAWVVSCSDLAATIPFRGPCGQLTTVSGSPDELAGSTSYSFTGRKAAASGAGMTLPIAAATASGPLLLGDGTEDQPPTTGAPDVVIDPALLPANASEFAVSLLLVQTNGAPDVVERVRTHIEAATPGSIVRTLPELVADGTRIVIEVGRIVAIGTLGTLLMAGCSLAVSVAGGIIERRRPFALLRLAGMPLSRLRIVTMCEAAAPLIVASSFSAVLGVAVAMFLIRVAGSFPLPMPDPALVVLLVGGIGAALAIVTLTFPLLRSVTDVEEARFE